MAGILEIKLEMHIYRVFRNLCGILWELIVKCLKIMKKSHTNICPICLRL